MIEVLDREVDCYTSSHERMILVGPPGTGKTRTMLDGWLVPAVNDGVPVVSLTYMKRVALETRGKLAQRTGYKEDRLKDVCRTIHAEAYHAELMANGSVSVYQEDGSHKRKEKKTHDEEIDEADAIDLTWASLMNPHVDLRKDAVRLWEKARNKFWPEEHDAPMRDLMTRVYADDIWPKHLVGELVAEAQAYEAEKQASGSIDFSDMLFRALDYPATPRVFLLVDEAQDMSPLQIALVNHWATRAAHTVLIGDPDQGICGFTGADGTYLTRSIRDGETARALVQSYRVPSSAHEVAREVILRNHDRVDSPYAPAETVGTVERYRDHGHALIDMCSRLKADEKASGFVVARFGAALARYAAWLTSEGEPYVAERGVGSPMGKCVAIVVLTGLASLRNTKMVRADDAVRLAEALPGRPLRAWFTGTKKDAVSKTKLYKEEDAEQLLDTRTLALCGLKVEPLLLAETIDDAARMLDMKDLWPLLKIVERYGLDGLRKEPRIRLTTIHTSKGREAEVVIVDLGCPKPAAAEIATRHGAADAERRVLYVAVTRTLRDLLLVDSETRDDMWRLLM